MVSDTFLHEGAKKRSMMIMINSMKTFRGDTNLIQDPDDRTHPQMVHYIQSQFPLLPTDANREAMIKDWIHDRNWLQSLKSDGISLIMHCFLDFIDGNNAPCLSAVKEQKINYYLDHVRLQVQIRDPDGNFYMEIKRCWKYSELLAKIAHRRLASANTPPRTYSPDFINLSQWFGSLHNGSTIQLNRRIPSAPPSAAHCPGSFQIFVSGFGTSGTLYVLP